MQSLLIYCLYSKNVSECFIIVYCQLIELYCYDEIAHTLTSHDMIYIKSTQLKDLFKYHLLLFIGDPYDPLIALKYFQEDDESIIDEDLVCWVSLGVNHIPTSEDIPVTTTGRSYIHDSVAM